LGVRQIYGARPMSLDGTVDIYDLRKMSEAWLKNEVDDGFNADADLNYDGKINNTDSDILSANWLGVCPSN